MLSSSICILHIPLVSYLIALEVVSNLAVPESLCDIYNVHAIFLLFTCYSSDIYLIFPMLIAFPDFFFFVACTYLEHLTSLILDTIVPLEDSYQSSRTSFLNLLNSFDVP